MDSSSGLHHISYPGAVLVNYSEAQGLPGKTFKLMQITHDSGGHTINNTQCFSPDDQWIVYDTRNNDSQISSTGCIRMVNTRTAEIKELYHTRNQTLYGPVWEPHFLTSA